MINFNISLIQSRIQNSDYFMNFCSSPAFSNVTIAEIVNFYVKLSLQYHITFHADQGTKQIDHLFQQFYIRHQNVIHTDELIFKNLELFYIFSITLNVELLF